MAYKLIDYDPDDRKQVTEFPLSILPQALPNINCFQALDYLQVRALLRDFRRAYVCILAKPVVHISS